MKKPRTQNNKKWRIIAWVLAIVWAFLIFILSSMPGDSYPDHPGFLNYLVHFLEYFVLAALLVVGFTDGRLRTKHIIVVAIIFTACYAATDELHQYFVPGRLADVIDWIVDTLGATAGAFVATWLLKSG